MKTSSLVAPKDAPIFRSLDYVLFLTYSTNKEGRVNETNDTYQL